ncbi:MAG: lysophospholipid acyltransferase family protein [Novosphingobium sp.]|nr:lysophospholipid acyltransferase family protein [Novosphingobium sp.]
MGLLLPALLPLHFVWRIFTKHSPWPRIFLKSVSWFVGLKIEIRGSRVKRGAFLIANHVSWLDVPALGGITGSAFVGHDGLTSHPVMHWLCKLNDTVLIARHRRASVASQVEQVRQALRDTGALTVFAEGTTSDGTQIPPFKSSLLSALTPVPDGISVQPVWLDYGPRSKDVAWVGEEAGVANFLKLTARGDPIELVVHFLPVLSGDALSDRKTITAAARDGILAAKQH